MVVPLRHAPSTLPFRPRSSEDERLRLFLFGLLAPLVRAHAPLERRREQRYPFPRLLRITPLAADGRTPSGPELVVAGRHLSERGLGFFHPEPLQERLVAVTLDRGRGQTIQAVLDVTWCRFTPEGWYESGGRFLRVFEPAHAAPTPVPAVGAGESLATAP